jgi:predicted DNA-binding transcriptional regulator AlpA
MTTDSPGLGTTSKHTVTLSKWVNERPPPLNELLTSHETVRLTKRHHWKLATLAFLRCFPRKLRFHGRCVGWLRADVDCWLGRNHRISKPRERCRHSTRRKRNGHRICLSPAAPIQQSPFRPRSSAPAVVIPRDLIPIQSKQVNGRDAE